jgi:diadenosine tetraphosphatase ApaH/serine/threonine PP2A family protein phosphatase
MDFLGIQNSPADLAAKTAAVGAALLQKSQCLRQPNFESISEQDLADLFALYDRHFFNGELGQQVRAKTGLTLAFSLSSRMTRAGGKTIQHRQRMPDGKIQIGYEIAVASRMLFMTFAQIGRPVVVCGLVCTDRLAALERIFEHELIHLIELLTWGKSSCSQPRFKGLVRNIFGHTDTRHALVTPREHAAVQHGVRVGDLVEFDFQGRRLVGRVNRINRRATVLVEDANGLKYSDGKRYQKFYVPVAWVKRAGVTAG